MDTKQHILTQTDHLFCQYGIKSVTMDDIARHLGISKKTIYLHFQDKNELVYTLIKNRMELQNCAMELTSAQAENAVHEFFLAVTEMQEILSNLNPMLFYDLQKYHPQAWQVFKSFKEKNLYKTIYNNLQRGISEGLYREDLNLDVLCKMRTDQVENVFNQNAFPAGRYSVLQVMIVLTEHFLYGICTLKGHRLINHYKNINED